ncbi:MAG: hypothetical protein KDK72_06710 [Chlamydiia bacterium]|nr:hypothetical protein [Chlamydiia bacterium]
MSDSNLDPRLDIASTQYSEDITKDAECKTEEVRRQTRAKDEKTQADQRESEVRPPSSSSYVVLDNGGMSLMDYLNSVGDALMDFEKSVQNSALMDMELFKKFHEAAGVNASELQNFVLSVNNMQEQYQRLVHDENSAIDQINDLISDYNGKIPDDQKAVQELNQSIQKYNSGDISADQLTQDVTQYNAYVNGRQSDINQINKAVGQYNQKIEAENEKIEKENQQREQAGLSSISELPTLNPYMPTVQPYPTTLAASSLNSLPEPQDLPMIPKAAEPPSVGDEVNNAMSRSFQSSMASIAFLAGNQEYVNVQHEYMQYLLKGIRTWVSDPTGGVPSLYFESSTGQKTGVSTVVTGLAPIQVSMMMGRDLIKRSLSPFDVPFSEKTFDEIAMFHLEIMAQSGLLAAPAAMALLIDKLPNFSQGRQPLDIAVAISYAKRINTVIGSGIVEQNILAILNKSPSVQMMEAEKKESLIQVVTAAAKLPLHLSAIAQISKALGTPGLTQQLTAHAMGASGIGGPIHAASVFDNLHNIFYSTLIKSEMADLLIKHKEYNPEIAQRIVQNAVAKFMETPAFADHGDMVNQLTIHLVNAGIGNRPLARNLAFSAIATLHDSTPFSPERQLPLHRTIFLKLVDKEVIQGESMKNALFPNGDTQNLWAKISRTIARMQQDSKPQSLDAICTEMTESLVNRGVAPQEGRAIADRFVTHLQENFRTQNAFAASSTSIAHMRGALLNILINRNAKPEIAPLIAERVMGVLFAHPYIFNNLNFPDQFAEVVDIAVVLGERVEPEPLRQALLIRGIEPKLANLLAERVALGVQRKHPKPFSLEEALKNTLKRELSSIIGQDSGIDEIDLAGVVRSDVFRTNLEKAIPDNMRSFAAELTDALFRIPSAYRNENAFRFALRDLIVAVSGAVPSVALSVAQNVSLDGAIDRALLEKALSNLPYGNAIAERILPDRSMLGNGNGFWIAMRDIAYASLPLSYQEVSALIEKVRDSRDEIVDSGAIERGLKKTLASMGIDENKLPVPPKEIVERVLEQPQAYEGSITMRMFLFSTLFLQHAIPFHTAKEIAIRTPIDDPFDRERVHDLIQEALEDQGCPPEEADELADLPTINLFAGFSQPIHSSESSEVIDVLSINELLNRHHLAKSLEKIFIAHKINHDQAEGLSKEVAHSAYHYVKAFKDAESFYGFLQDAVQLHVKNFDADEAHTVSREVAVTPHIRREALMEAMIRALDDFGYDKSRIPEKAARTANHVFRTPQAFKDNSQFKQVIRDALVAVVQLAATDANHIASSMEIGFIRAGGDPFVTVHAPDLQSNAAIARRVTEITVEALLPQLGEKRARAVAKDILNTLIGLPTPEQAVKGEIRNPVSILRQVKDEVNEIVDNSYVRSGEERIDKAIEDMMTAYAEPSMTLYVMMRKLLDPGTAMIIAMFTSMMYAENIPATSIDRSVSINV